MSQQYAVDRYIVGYDPVSERAVFSVKIPKSNFDLLRTFAHFGAIDPQGYDSYKLEYAQVAKLLKLLPGHSDPPNTLDYFLEAEQSTDDSSS
jgi:hypothetical protein